jgi:hypothetical protein
MPLEGFTTFALLAESQGHPWRSNVLQFCIPALNPIPLKGLLKSSP